MRFNKRAFDAVNRDYETTSFQNEQTNPDQSKILGYTAGAYGDRRVKACSDTQHIEDTGVILNEWKLIPQIDKDKLVNWLNKNINFDNDLYDHSIRMYETHPVMEILLKEGTIKKPEPRKLPDPPLHKTCTEWETPVATLEYSHEEAKPFMDEFLKHSEELQHDMTPIFNYSKLRIGFLVDNTDPKLKAKEVHFVKLSTLNPIWSPKSQPELFNDAKSKMLKKSAKNDILLNKILRTTEANDMGPNWAGFLTLNVAQMSTLPNGTQNPLQLPTPRYKITWTNIVTRETITEYYESVLISKMIKDNIIEASHGTEKANIHPHHSYVPYGEEKCLIGEERDQFLKEKGNPKHQRWNSHSVKPKNRG